jgi:hypothetical protein
MHVSASQHNQLPSFLTTGVKSIFFTNIQLAKLVHMPSQQGLPSIKQVGPVHKEAMAEIHYFKEFCMLQMTWEQHLHPSENLFLCSLLSQPFSET